MKESCSLSRPDDLAIGSISSGWLMANVLCHSDDVRSFPKSSGWHNVSWTLCHPDEITNLIPKSSEWLSYSQYLIRMTYGHCGVSSGWLTILAYVIWMIQLIWSLSHPDDLAIPVSHPDGSWTLQMSSGWLTISANVIRMRWLIWSQSNPNGLAIASVSHPDDLWTLQDVIRMTYDITLSHLDDVTSIES